MINAFVYSEREFQRGDEIAWYPDGDKIVRNVYNPATAYAFGDYSFPIDKMSKSDVVFPQLTRNKSEKC